MLKIMYQVDQYDMIYTQGKENRVNAKMGL
jgi:hypothetical protein